MAMQQPGGLEGLRWHVLGRGEYRLDVDRHVQDLAKVGIGTDWWFWISGHNITHFNIGAMVVANKKSQAQTNTIPSRTAPPNAMVTPWSNVESSRLIVPYGPPSRPRPAVTLVGVWVHQHHRTLRRARRDLL